MEKGTYVAHKYYEPGSAEPRVQFLEEHLEATSKMCGQFAAPAGLQRTAELCGAFHDYGKACKEFQDYIRGDSNNARGSVDHSYAGAKYLMELAEKTGSKALKEYMTLVSHVLLSHHGLHDWIEEDGTSYMAGRISKGDTYKEVCQNISSDFSEDDIVSWMQEVKKELHPVYKKIKDMSKDNTEFNFYHGLLERYLQSCLNDADASDTAEFYTGVKQVEEYTPAVWEEISSRFERRAEKYRKLPGKINAIRTRYSDEAKKCAANPASCLMLPGPTGVGKTMASTRFGVEFAKLHGKNRVMYLGSLKKLLTQNADFIRDIVGEEYFLEHHSDMAESLDGEEEEAWYRLRSSHWDVPVIATTYAQFMNAFFKGKASCIRRAHALANSVIIMDEIQETDDKLVYNLNMQINFLTHVLGCTVVLCTATQPAFDKLKHALILDENPQIVENAEEYYEIFKRTRLQFDLETVPYSIEASQKYCEGLISQKGSTLIIVNTKRACKKLYKCLKQNGKYEVYHISTYMCEKHQKAVLEQVKRNLWEERINPGMDRKTVLVATPLMQAGVDISFPCVIRALSGLDNIIQAAGRCNRNGEYEVVATVYVFNMKENLFGLPATEAGAAITRRIYNSGRYPDMMSMEALNQYDKMYYTERSKSLNYYVEDLGCQTTLFDLLSSNTLRTELGRAKDVPFYRGQAFKTAGSVFQVISDETTPVIVPYDDEAKKIIKKLSTMKNTPANLYEYNRLVWRVQRYMVGVYDNARERLEACGALQHTEIGAIVLREEWYDSECGLIMPE